MRDLEGKIKEQPFLWFMWTASGTIALPELSRVPPFASLIGEAGICATLC